MMMNKSLALILVLALAGCDDGGGGTDSGTTPMTDAGPMGMTDAGPMGMTDAGPMTPALRGVRLNMTDMAPHVGQRMDLRIVNASNTLMFHGVISALPDAAFDFIMPNSTPEGMAELQFSADLNGNGMIDPPPMDHGWRRDIAATGMVAIPFAHSATDLVDINMPAPTPMGGDFTMNFTGMGPHVGQTLEVRVYMNESGRLAGRFLMTPIGMADFTVALQGIIQDGVEYRVDYFADLNMNGMYDPPPMDHAWRAMGTGTASGLTLDYSHDTAFTDIGF